jgi:streptogramin lyase
VDAKDRFWFGEYWANKIGMLDTKSKQFQEWSPATQWSQPYDAVGDKNGEVWSGGMSTDLVYRLKPETGEIIEYLLPSINANIRRIDVDNSSSRVSCWVGEDHHAKLARIETLE